MLIPVALILSIVFSLVSVVNVSGQTIQIVDESNFCTFLPPTNDTDRNISDSETEANAFCIGSTPLALGAERLSSGFILSAHYVKTDNYVQITGLMDPTQANLDSSDEGGQYDIKAPDGASCAGWDYFVNLVEPFGSDYCIRCCNNDSDCNRGISEYGCERIVPGDYSMSSNGTSSTAISTVSSVAVSSTASVFATTLESSVFMSSVSDATTSSLYTNSISSSLSPTSGSSNPFVSSVMKASSSSDAAQKSDTSQSISRASSSSPYALAILLVFGFPLFLCNFFFLNI